MFGQILAFGTINFIKHNPRMVLSGCVLIAFFALALLAPWLAPYLPNEVDPSALRLPPFWKEGSDPSHWLGTDDVGRDLASRLMYGARISLGVGAWVVALSTSLGALLGLIAGYCGGFVDRCIMHTIDVLMSLPSILLAIVVVTLLGPGLTNAVVAVSLVALPGMVRVVRASVIQEKSKSYIIASRCLGAGHFRQLFKNIFPSCVASLMVQATLSFSDGILNVAALGFLGLGAQPPVAEWGTMLADARPFIETAPTLVTLPGLCILVVVLAFNLLGDGLRDCFDPRLKK